MDEGPTFTSSRASRDTNTTAKQRLRNRETTEQFFAPADLRFISQPRNGKIEATSQYVFDDSAGENITIYVVDTGANPESPDFSHMMGKTDWLWPSEEIWNSLSEKDFDEPYKSYTDLGDHGSCVISKAAGFYYGVAKKANIVVVKLVSGITEKTQGLFVSASLIKALANVIQDMEDRAKEGKPVNGTTVVNISLGVGWDPTYIDDKYWISELEFAIVTLLALDAVIVTAAGNSRVTTLIDHDPPIFTETGLTSTE